MYAPRNLISRVAGLPLRLSGNAEADMSYFESSDPFPERIGKAVGDAMAVAIVVFVIALLFGRFF
jgi:hypothetical protein